MSSNPNKMSGTASDKKSLSKKVINANKLSAFSNKMSSETELKFIT